MPIFLKYGSVKGDATEAKHKDWIEIESCQWAIARNIITTGTVDRESSAPSVSEITVTKVTDAATSKLFSEALQGEGQDATIEFTKTGKGGLDVYLSYTLSNTMVSGYSFSSGGDRPAESLSLNFTKISLKVVDMTSAGATGTPSSVGWDLAQQKLI